MNEDELRQTLSVMDGLKEQIESLSAQLELIQESVTDFSRAKETAKSYTESATDTEMLVSVGGGVYLPAKIVNTGRGVLYSAAGYSFEEPIAKIIEVMDGRIKELVESSQKVYQRMTEMQNQLNSLQAAVEQEARKSQGRVG